MQTVDTIEISADPAVVYRTASDILHWPDILPHYRWVKVLIEQSNGSLVEMAAQRGWIPVRWTAVQRCDAEKRRIHYRHIGGATKGMGVRWELTPTATGTHVELIHELTLDTPIIRSWIGKIIVGRYFVHYIASRTLHVMKYYLEEERPCVEQSSPALDR
ncbi:MAG TPA: SRPBCC family protein [Armatimonadota bacterium]|nr:SRPBCC family protein [Armatimonadota bacterium]